MKNEPVAIAIVVIEATLVLLVTLGVLDAQTAAAVGAWFAAVGAVLRSQVTPAR